MSGGLRYELNETNPGERKRFIRNLFDSIVPTYDLLNRLLSMGIDSGWRNFLVRRSGEPTQKPVLDVCCGTGDLSRRFRKAGNSCVSLDFSLPMLEKGKSKGWLENKSIAGDASILPFKSSSFRCVSIAFGIRNLPDPARFLEECFRVLEPGGSLYILELTRPKSRPVRFLYDMYLGRILPFVGGLISGRRRAYRYLSETIATFISPEELSARIAKAGFGKVHLFPRTMGIATVYECIKAEGLS